LKAPQVGVAAAGSQKAWVVTILDHTAMLDGHDPISAT
jgi:hypothetical protein